MLLTLKPPLQSDFARQSSSHVYSPPRSEPVKLHSPPDSKSIALPPFSETQPPRMSTPHRLPPPLGMTLPNPNQDRGPPPPPPPPLAQTQPMGQLPAPPTSQWQGTEDAMRNWLMAKSEEDKRKQEEEKSRQETLKLEQRKIEQSMLRDSLQGGIPPYMVPMIFAGMGSAALANQSVEWAQHYLAHMNINNQQQQPPPPPPPQQLPPSNSYPVSSQQQQQQQQALPPPQRSPDLHRERSNPGPQPNPYAQHQPALQSSSASLYGADRYRSGQPPIQAAPGPTSAPRAPGGLSRLNTGEMQIHHPPPPGAQLPVQHQSQPPSQQDAAQSTPTSIYFHHWVPPNSNKEPGTPTDYAHSPKKRKTNAGHGKTPETSPSFTQMTSAGRRNRASSLQHSEISHTSRQDGHRSNSRPPSSHRRPSNTTSEPADRVVRRGSSQPETTHSTQSRQASNGPEQKRGGSGTPKREAEGPPS
ncbi:hypothetical protein MMC10_007407 [Thelotrema lepadinum]|nr:hypothetical protein [Thelotrema lepadinum]